MEKKETVKRSVEIPIEHYKILKQMKEEQDRSINYIINIAIKQYLLSIKEALDTRSKLKTPEQVK